MKNTSKLVSFIMSLMMVVTIVLGCPSTSAATATTWYISPIDSGHQATKGNYAYTWWIYDNIFELDSQLTQILFRSSEGVDLEMDTEYAIIENNHFRNLGMGIEMNLRAEDSSLGMNNITVRNNVFENIGYDDETWANVICMVGYESSSITFNNIYIYHNTIASPGTEGGNPTMGVYIESSGVVQNVYIRNNIISDTVVYGYLMFRETEGTDNFSNIYSQYNILYNNVSNNSANFYDVSTVTNFVSNNNINSNPNFVSTTNFHLQSGSPAINTGGNYGVAKNKDGVTRDSNPDIGAYEFTSGATL